MAKQQTYFPTILKSRQNTAYFVKLKSDCFCLFKIKSKTHLINTDGVRLNLRVKFSAILTSPVAEERRKEGRHDAVVEHVRAVIRHYETIERSRTFVIITDLVKASHIIYDRNLEIWPSISAAYVHTYIHVLVCCLDFNNIFSLLDVLCSWYIVKTTIKIALQSRIS